MTKQPNLSIRHRPSVLSYFIQNFKTTFAIIEKAHVMVAVGWLFVSALGGLVASLTVPISWEHRLALGLGIFLIIQFGVITPIRMWRNAVWVADIEKILEDLWDCHSKGVGLLNVHFTDLIKQEELARDIQLQMNYIDDWNQQFQEWTEETRGKIENLYPLEAKGFENIVSFNPQSITGGLNEVHDSLRSMLLARLNKIDAIIQRHQPAILPER